MPRRRHRWDPVCDLPDGLVRPVPPDPRGLAGPTKRQAAEAGAAWSEWRRVWRGWYVPTYADRELPEQRVLEASVLMSPGGAVTGWAALRLHGATFFDGRGPDGSLAPVDVVTPHYRAPVPGIAWRQDRLEPGDVVTRAGVPVTRPERAVLDAMRRAPDLRAAVRAVDMACAAELVSPQRVARYAAPRSGWLGLPLVSEALDLCDERSRSPLETDGRLVWRLDAGLPRPRVNVPVFSRRGKLLGIADLIDEVAGLVVEFDGADHAGARRRSVRTRGARAGCATTGWRSSVSPATTCTTVPLSSGGCTMPGGGHGGCPSRSGRGRWSRRRGGSSSCPSTSGSTCGTSSAEVTTRRGEGPGAQITHVCSRHAVLPCVPA